MTIDTLDVQTDASTFAITVRFGENLTDEKQKEKLNELCNQYWKDGDPPDRHALALIVRDVLLQLAERPDEWLPQAAHAETGKRLEINLAIQMGDIDNALLKLRSQAEDRIVSIRESLIEIRDELSDGD